MSFSHYSPRIYMDIDDVKATADVLSRRINADGESLAAPFYMGAYLALFFILVHDDIRDQSVFMKLFDNSLKEQGITPIKAVEKGEE